MNRKQGAGTSKKLWIFPVACRLLPVTLCLFAAALSLAAKKETLRPLRFPFGLTPGMSTIDAKTVLSKKALKFLREDEVDGRLAVQWQMAGQIVHGTFIPRRATGLFDDGKMISFSLAAGDIASCGTAQPIFLSALGFVRVNYDPKEAPVVMEPALDTLDCGPAFKSTTYQLRRESKRLVCFVMPTKTPAGYEVRVTYHDRQTFKDTSGDTPSPLAAPDVQNKTTQENL